MADTPAEAAAAAKSELDLYEAFDSYEWSKDKDFLASSLGDLTPW